MTRSERLFEHYLGTHNVIFDRVAEGERKVPVYKVPVGGRNIWLEVKEFARTKWRPTKRGGESGVDPCEPICRKIAAARKKFEAHKGEPCCLVLYNEQSLFVSLEIRRASLRQCWVAFFNSTTGAYPNDRSGHRVLLSEGRRK